MGESELTWRAVQLDDELLDFNQLLGVVTQWSVAYAVCYVHSDAARSGLLLKVGSDDEAKIYLNGKPVYTWDTPRNWASDQDVVAGVELRAGLNVLVLKVVNGVGGWQASVRFTDAAGQPPKGIKVQRVP